MGDVYLQGNNANNPAVRAKQQAQKPAATKVNEAQNLDKEIKNVELNKFYDKYNNDIQAGNQQQAKIAYEDMLTRGFTPDMNEAAKRMGKSQTEILQKTTADNQQSNPNHKQSNPNHKQSNPNHKQSNPSFADVNVSATNQAENSNNVPEQPQQLEPIEQPKNSIPSYWDYMKQTSGGKAGAISRMAGGVLSALGAAGLRGAAGATGGKYGDANATANPDAFGLQSYGKLQQDQIKMEQYFNAKVAELPIQQRQMAMQLYNQLSMIIKSGDVSAETQKKINEALADIKAGELPRAMKKLRDAGYENDDLAKYTRAGGGKTVLGAVIDYVDKVSPFYSGGYIEKTRDEKIKQLKKWRKN